MFGLLRSPLIAPSNSRTNRTVWPCAAAASPLLIAILLSVVTLKAGHAQASCAMRGDLGAHPNLSWADLRTACEAEHEAYKRAHPVGFNWFVNAANGFAGFPYVLQRILPELAPEIWGRPEENFARFGFFPDADPKRPLPRGIGIATTSGRPLDADYNIRGEIDFAAPGLHVVTLSCGACHTGQVRTDAGLKIVDGAPNTQIDVRKWRAAYAHTVQTYLAGAEQIRRGMNFGSPG